MSLKDITRKPKIGFLGIMQELYDNTLPGITKRQEGYAREVAARLAGVADVKFPKAARCREDIEEVLKIFAEPLLRAVKPTEREYSEASRLLVFLNNFSPISSPIRFI